MDVTKTTFYLSDETRARLKALALRRHKTVTELLAEGAELVLDRYLASVDREELDRRAAEAAERLRRGLYAGPAVSDTADALLYGRGERPRARHGAAARRRRRPRRAP
jgi:predicted DNA-binding protein